MVVLNPTGNWGHFRDGIFPVPQSPPPFPLLCQAGQAVGQPGNYGNSCYEGTEWNTPRVQGLGHRFLELPQPGQPNGQSLTAERGCLWARNHVWGCACTDSAHDPPLLFCQMGVSTSHFQIRNPRLREFGQLVYNELARKHRSCEQAQICLTHGLFDSSERGFREKPSDISEAPFEILLSLKTSNAATSGEKSRQLQSVAV